MKMLSILLISALVGCAGQQTLEELEKEALISGDWTEVEKREQLLARKSKREGQDCPDGLTNICVEQGMKASCECLRPKPASRLRSY
jgi:hypothetical protein